MIKCRLCFLLTAFAMAPIFLCCCQRAQAGKVRLSVAEWNVQTFFDARKDGTEYAEFTKSKYWGEDAYTARLRRLSAALKKLDAEVVVLEEIESEKVLYDLANFLAGDWNFSRHYVYGCFSKLPGSAIGCAVLSRYPLENLRAHALELRGEAPMPKMRPLMCVDICKKGRRLTLLVNHWKSKSGGGGEQWRLWQEKVLAVHLETAARSGAALACGDFNKDIGEFRRENEGTVLLHGLWTDKDISVRSPWYGSDGSLVEPGSYCFHGEWSRIDGFFSAGDIAITSFAPQMQGEWCNAQTHEPYRYQIWNGSGFSDHLPLRCTVSF